jgi:hypothetical protein
MSASAAGAQTERRGVAGPVGDLLGGEASPAAVYSNPVRATHSHPAYVRRMYVPSIQPVLATVKESR